MSFFQRRIAAAAMMAALALPVLAQPAPAMPPAAGASAEQAHKPGDRQERRQAHMAQRIDALKAQLKLTPAQEPAWTAFTTAMQPAERPARLDRTMDRKEMEKLTTPERIDRMRALRAQHAAEADRRGEATKTFYAALTPEQQKTFDAQAQRMHGMHSKGGHGGKGDHRGHHGDGGHGDDGRHGMMRGGDMPMGGPAR
ncbi:Spy/CpxP family protein refolding chaperone [Acidovorax sp. JG5]|jgi:Spy/CpxP family protein refolding chaperone|uniref:Spy/CpxP family protein refolding chaperone n=1 Tax=Acidovorax sp. JG5 TaxID=2822718 RepID=UPI001B342866|nr:Spy/CpxP family protein refolding chaperone [Acidovorax sp. JG5]MBP3979377.1 Spy/CpxP family protein refolding chaperone [Acidovorax sp. JG5]